MSMHQKRADQLSNGDVVILKTGSADIVVEVRGVIQFESEPGMTNLALYDLKTGLQGEFKVRHQQKFDVFEGDA